MEYKLDMFGGDHEFIGAIPYQLARISERLEVGNELLERIAVVLETANSQLVVSRDKREEK